MSAHAWRIFCSRIWENWKFLYFGRGLAFPVIWTHKTGYLFNNKSFSFGLIQLWTCSCLRATFYDFYQDKFGLNFTYLSRSYNFMALLECLRRAFRCPSWNTLLSHIRISFHFTLHLNAFWCLTVRNCSMILTLTTRALLYLDQCHCVLRGTFPVIFVHCSSNSVYSFWCWKWNKQTNERTNQQKQQTK